jgi:gliding motility-associated-like protein
VRDIPVQVFLPNSFTPNNDGLNDTFFAKGLFIKDFSMEIYSRWGEILFSTNQIDRGWDGLYNGTLVPEGSYIYKVRVEDTQGRVITKSGAVNVLRKP